MRMCAAIATPHPEAAAAGRDILLNGGNAVDAAVAATLACCVAEPAMVGLGGYGGSMVAFMANASGSVPSGPVAIDFDSRAPLSFQSHAFENDPDSYETGYLSITAPAVVAGLDLALTRFGTMPWSAVSGPAIALAEGGVPVTSALKRQLDDWTKKADALSRQTLFASSSQPNVGEKWVQRDLAQLLRRLSDDGPSAFYHGDIARAIVRQVQAHGGILSEADFAACRAAIVEPLGIDYRSRRVLTPPPPSGGLTSLQILKTLEQFDLSDLRPWGAEYFHLVAEAAKLSWKDRATYMGDPDKTPIPFERLLSADAARENAARIRRDGIVPNERGRVNAPSSPHTVNIVTADAAGNVVSMTATLGYAFGSAVVIGGLGLVMNHGMSRFDLTPGSPNAPAAGKRMFHNMAPTVFIGDDGRAVAAVGLPGGPKIVTVTAQLVVSLLDFGATPEIAVTAGRIHAEADDPVAVSAAVSDDVIDQLRALGHTVRRGQTVGGPPNEIGGMANALVIESKTGSAAAASQAGEGAALAFDVGRDS